MSMDGSPDFDEKARERDGTMPRFFMDVRPNKARSDAEGHPCFDDIEMVEILIPGDRLSSPVQMVNDGHRNRWPKAYEAFKKNQEAPVDGTPLTQMPGMTKSQVEEMHFMHVRTVEQLANLSDEQLSKVAPMNGRALRDKAKRWVEATAGDAPNEKLAAENRALHEKTELMATQMADLQRIVTELQAQHAVVPGVEA